MQWLIDSVGAIFGDGLTADERRAKVLNKITMHGTPGRRTFDSVLSAPRPIPGAAVPPSSGGAADDDDDGDGQTRLWKQHAHHGFFVLVTNKEDWAKTSGDFPRSGRMRQPIYRDVDSVDFIGEQIVTDGTVLNHARRHIDDSGAKLPGFHSIFTDSEALLVYVHASHLGGRVEYTRNGAPYLAEPLNKTRDPYVTFDVAAVIEQPDKADGQCSYFILQPDESVLLPAYNRECTRLGKKTV